MKKVILISGGSSGLGRALAKELTDEYKVVILSRNAELTAETAKETGCSYVVADVGNYNEVKAAVESVIEEQGKLDCLINCAGLWIQGPLEENSPETIENVIAANTIGTIFLTHAVLPYMKKQKGGRIINVISQAGLHVKAERSVYQASKWAITGFTNSLRMEVAPHGISVCGFYPGAFQTDFFAKAGVVKEGKGRMTLDEVVRAVMFMVKTPDHLVIPELGIKNISN